jgi:hypothetical protein
MFKYLQIMRKLYSNPLHLGITLARPGTILPVIREITRIERNKKGLFWNQSGNRMWKLQTCEVQLNLPMWSPLLSSYLY